MAARPAASGRGPRRLASPQAIGLLLTIVSACGFGSGPLFAKPVYAAGVDWLTLLLWRFFFGALASWAWLLVFPAHRRALRSLSRRRVAMLVALGVLYVGNSATYFAALETVPASLAALIVYIYPALVAVLTLRLGRRLRGRRPWAALGLAMVGVALALGGIDPRAMPPVSGLLLSLASPIIYGLWIVLSARLAGERPAPRQTPPPEALEPIEVTDPAPAAAIMMTAAFAVYLGLNGGLAALGVRPLNPVPITAAAWGGLLGVGLVATALAMQAFYAGAKRIGAAQAALVSTVEPVWTIVLATAFFAESLAPLQLLGGACIIVAVLIAQTTPAVAGVPTASPATAEPTGEAA